MFLDKERACTAHTQDPYSAESVVRGKLTYMVLRCPVCDRPQGERLVRRQRGSRVFG
jgi:hypothetical protein